MTKTGYSDQIAELVESCRRESLPESVLLPALRAYRDTIGVMLAGSLDESAVIARTVAATFGGVGESTVVGWTKRLSLGGAALTNGVAGHALDFDDVSMKSGSHSSAILFSAGLAVGELVDATTRQLLHAYAVGYEVIDRLAGIFRESSFRRGWHGTGINGPIGASVTCGYLLGLTAEQLANALGIAAASSGAVYRNIGTMVKPFHAGRAAMSGVLAGMLAQAGYDSAHDALDGPLGYAWAFAGQAEPGPLGPLGRPFTITDPGVGIKSYPVGSPLMGAVEGALFLARTHGISPEDVTRIEVGVSDKTKMIARYDRPASVHAARYSIPFCVAVAIAKLKVTQDEFQPAVLAEPIIRDLVACTTVEFQQDFLGIEGWPPPTRVRIVKRSGEYHETVWSSARGLQSGGYLSEEEARAKYLDCASRVVGQEGARQSLRFFEPSGLDRRVRETLRGLSQEPAARGA